MLYPHLDRYGRLGSSALRLTPPTGDYHIVKTSTLTYLRHELDGEGSSRFGLTERQREVFGCYYGTSDMTIAAIAKRLDVMTRTIQRDMNEIRKKLARAGIPLLAQAERRGRRVA